MRTAVSERSCARARRALSLVLDREATAGDVEALALHLGGCGACRRYAARVSAVTRELREVRPEQRHLAISDRARRENGHA
jgi:predicted anti-sigma-YlaC factor YlaD